MRLLTFSTASYLTIGSVKPNAACVFLLSCVYFAFSLTIKACFTAFLLHRHVLLSTRLRWRLSLPVSRRPDDEQYVFSCLPSSFMCLYVRFTPVFSCSSLCWWQGVAASLFQAFVCAQSDSCWSPWGPAGTNIPRLHISGPVCPAGDHTDFH